MPFLSYLVNVCLRTHVCTGPARVWEHVLYVHICTGACTVWAHVCFVCAFARGHVLCGPMCVVCARAHTCAQSTPHQRSRTVSQT